MSVDGPDVTATKVYFQEEKTIRVHRSRVQPAPAGFPAGYYYYGHSQHGPGHYPQWVDTLCRDDDPAPEEQRYHLRFREQRDTNAWVELLKGGSDVEQ